MAWFEKHEQYQCSDALPPALIDQSRLSLIRVYDSGKTQPGWGAREFVANHTRGHFRPTRALKFFTKHGEPFGIVMRSIPLICVDIDGKNGGHETARVLNLPVTLAERSKSMNGYHLFYRIPGTLWNTERGYSEFPDVIGLLPGIDIKGTGVVYHYSNQVWNEESVKDAPPRLMELIGRVRDVRQQAKVTRDGVSSLAEEDKVIVHDQLLDKLEQPIPKGSRNNILYSIATQMYAAEFPAWDSLVYDRGLEIGLEINEIRSIIENVRKYG